jgi:hypothetical protein
LARYDATDGLIATGERAGGNRSKQNIQFRLRLSSKDYSEYMHMNATSYRVPMCSPCTALI